MATTTDKYIPQYLDRWTLPKHYFGAAWPDYYVFLSRHRDSDTLTRSNFTCALEALGGEQTVENPDPDIDNDIETVLVVRESHCLVGWVEWIAIHESATDALRIADDIAKRLEGYPVVNEDHWSEVELEELEQDWASWGAREFADEVQRVFECSDALHDLLSDCPFDVAREYATELRDCTNGDELSSAITWAAESDEFTREQLAKLCWTLRAPK